MSMRALLVAGAVCFSATAAFAQNTSIINQSGVRNNALTLQRGRENTSFTYQEGKYNNAGAVQYGRKNGALIDQAGVVNNAGVVQNRKYLP